MSQAEVEAKAIELIGAVLGARRAKAIVTRNAEPRSRSRHRGVTSTMAAVDEAPARGPPNDAPAVERGCRGGALHMPDCLEAMEIAYRDLGLQQGGKRWPLGGSHADRSRRCALFPADDERRQPEVRDRRGPHQFRHSHMAELTRWAAAGQGACGAERSLCRFGAAVQHLFRRAAGDLSGRYRAAHEGRRDLRLGGQVSGAG